jgi:hypothetical protein
MIHSANQHPMTRIAYNEHRSAPARSARAKRDPETFEAERHASASAVKAARKKPRKAGPAQPSKAPRRARAVKRAIRREAMQAIKDGDLVKAKRLANSIGVDLIVGGVKV